METRYAIQMELSLPCHDSTVVYIEVGVVPDGCLFTHELELAKAGLKDWRREFPAINFRLMEWTSREVKEN
jgi:hypothetical protein